METMDLVFAYELVDGCRDQYIDTPACELPPITRAALATIAEHRRLGMDPSNEYGRG